MTITEIIKAVRWCIDEEAVNAASLADASTIDGLDIDDTALMNNIIMSKIGDAIRWICLYGPPEILTGTDTTGVDTGVIEEHDNLHLIDNRITLPVNFVKLIRVRGSEWHRAVTVPILEDSEEYLQLNDDYATATNDRPQAALIDKKVKQLEVWPAMGTFEYTCVTNPTIPDTIEPETIIPLPPLAKTAFIYYIAFLLLTAYDDTRAAKMLEIAKMNLTRTDLK